jgi:hypothetical protein
MLVADLGLVLPANTLRMMARSFRLGDFRRRRQAIGLVPGGRILLERPDHFGQPVLEPMPRLPTEQLARTRDVELVMVVGHPHHEGFDERRLALVERVGHDRLELLLRPGAQRRGGFGHTQGRPVLDAVNQIAQLVLKRFIAHRLGLADQDRRTRGDVLASIDGAAEGVEHVLAVDHRLTNEGRARIKMALEVAQMNARHLIGERRHRGLLVIEPGEAQQDKRDAAVLLTDRLLGFRLAPGVGPARIDRLVLVDRLAGLSRSMHQHRARIDELLDVEALQRAEQPPRPFDVHRFIKRVLLTAEVEEGDEMDHARDVSAMGLAQLRHGLGDGGIVGEIGIDQREVGLPARLVEPDDRIALAQSRGERAADIACRAGDQDDRFPSFAQRLSSTGHGF